MGFDLNSVTKGVVYKPYRMILCGKEKIGKSTFGANAPNPIFIPIKNEEGIDMLDVASFPTVTTYEELLEAFTALFSEHDFKTVVIDSVSALEPLIHDKVCRENNADSIEKALGGYAKGYVEALRYWREIMAALDGLRENGINTILIGHATIKSQPDPNGDNYDKFTLDLHKKATETLFRWSDIIGFANAKVAVVKTDAGFNKKDNKVRDLNQRVLHTQSNASLPSGGRGIYGHLPKELPLDYDAFVKAVEDAKEQLAKEQK